MEFNSWRVYKEKGMTYIDVKTAENLDPSSVTPYTHVHHHRDSEEWTTSKDLEIESVHKTVSKEYVRTFKLKDGYTEIKGVKAETVDGRSIDLYKDETEKLFEEYFAFSIVSSFVSVIMILILVIRVIKAKKSKTPVENKKTITENKNVAAKEKEVKKDTKFIVCEFCGSENEPNARKCESCGASLKVSRK